MGKTSKVLSLGVMSVTAPEYVFISSNGTLVAKKEITRKHDEANRIITSCIDLMEECSMSLSDVDQFIVLSGPGSLTGIRVGLSPIRAWSYATGKPVVTLSTLEVMAYSQQRPLLTLIPARKDHYWIQAFSDSFMDTPRIVEKTYLEPYDTKEWLWLCPSDLNPTNARYQKASPNPEQAVELAATKKAQPWMRALPTYLFEMDNGIG